VDWLRDIIYDMVPRHSWILESVTLIGVADNVKRLLKNSVENWTQNKQTAKHCKINHQPQSPFLVVV